MVDVADEILDRIDERLDYWACRLRAVEFGPGRRIRLEFAPEGECGPVANELDLPDLSELPDLPPLPWEGDPTLVADKIEIQARKFSKPVPIHGTGAHRADRITVRNGIAHADKGTVYPE